MDLEISLFLILKMSLKDIDKWVTFNASLHACVADQQGTTFALSNTLIYELRS